MKTYYLIGIAGLVLAWFYTQSSTANYSAIEHLDSVQETTTVSSNNAVDLTVKINRGAPTGDLTADRSSAEEFVETLTEATQHFRRAIQTNESRKQLRRIVSNPRTMNRVAELLQNPSTIRSQREKYLSIAQAQSSSITTDSPLFVDVVQLAMVDTMGYALSWQGNPYRDEAQRKAQDFLLYDSGYRLSDRLDQESRIELKATLANQVDIFYHLYRSDREIAITLLDQIKSQAHGPDFAYALTNSGFSH